MGAAGEQALLHILKQDMSSHQKFKDCIVRSLALADVSSPNIDFVIELLFQTSK